MTKQKRCALASDCWAAAEFASAEGEAPAVGDGEPERFALAASDAAPFCPAPSVIALLEVGKECDAPVAAWAATLSIRGAASGRGVSTATLSEPLPSVSPGSGRLSVGDFPGPTACRDSFSDPLTLNSVSANCPIMVKMSVWSEEPVVDSATGEPRCPEGVVARPGPILLVGHAELVPCKSAPLRSSTKLEYSGPSVPSADGKGVEESSVCSPATGEACCVPLSIGSALEPCCPPAAAKCKVDCTTECE